MNPSGDTNSNMAATTEKDNKAGGWSKAAEEYAAMATTVPIPHYFNDLAAQYLIEAKNFQPNQSLLDACAGPGTFTCAVIKKMGESACSELKFFVTDYAEGMVETAKKCCGKYASLASNFTFQVVDAQNMSTFANDSQDVVGCMFGYFVPNRSKMFSELCRVCKPAGDGGISVIGTWKYAGFVLAQDDFLRFLGKLQASETSQVYKDAMSCSDASSLCQELRDAGYTEVAIHQDRKVFEIPSSKDMIKALFDNPMFKDNFTDMNPDDVHARWLEFLRQPGLPYHVDLDRNVLFVEYEANICLARK